MSPFTRRWISCSGAAALALGLAIGPAYAQDDVLLSSQGHPVEGALEPFLGPQRFESQRVFETERFPNIAVATDGTVIATYGRHDHAIRRSEDGGQTWGPSASIADGMHGGGLTVDENSGSIFTFVEDGHPPAPLTVYRSTDHGKTWHEHQVEIRPDVNGHTPSAHMNESGITLRHGEHAGRLLRATRWYGHTNARQEWPDHYTNAIYSDDGGETWHTSDPFPANGTGEAAMAELSNGSIYYNSRRHWGPQGVNILNRWIAHSNDGGHTWIDVYRDDVLPDGPQNTNYGLMGGLVRLPVSGEDILIYSNVVSSSGRRGGTVWASFDGGKTWPIKRRVTAGGFAYSSLSVGRPDTPSEGWIYLHYEEGGDNSTSQVARFNLSWILDRQEVGSLLTTE